jgi:hypothetical protein
MKRNACYRQIFAEFLHGVKESKPQWYSIKPLHYDIASLADLMEVHENLLRDLYLLDKKHAKSNTFYSKICSNFSSPFVHVPSSKGFV